MPEILFFSDEVEFSLENENAVKKWIREIAETEKCPIVDLNVIFTSDGNLLNINKNFLKRDYYTDIITFQNSEGKIDGEIYISVERVEENAKANEVDFSTELFRVMAHGVMHMCGYGDKTDDEISAMRSREDFYLNLRTF